MAEEDKKVVEEVKEPVKVEKPNEDSLTKDPIVLAVGACFIFLIGMGVGILLFNSGGGVVPTTSSTTTNPVVSTTNPSASSTVNLLVLNDKRCEVCDVSGLLAQLNAMISDLEIEGLDYSTSEGKQLYDDLGLTYLPAFLFDNTVKDAEAYDSLANYLEAKGNYLSLRVGANFDPTAEICDNGIDDTGDGLVDCDDPECASKLICNKDAIIECVEPYNLSADTVVFFHSNNCGYCQSMKPIVEGLQKENYSFFWAEVSDTEAMDVIETCLNEYITSGSVPQFICIKNAEIHVGAMPEETLKEFADDCINS